MTAPEYKAEIARVKAAIQKSNSNKLKRDYGKYLKRLKREVYRESRRQSDGRKRSSKRALEREGEQ